MAEVEITAPPSPIVEITGDDGDVIEFPAEAPVSVDVLTEGTQGTRGLRGEDAVVPDPGDLILYFENGLT